MWFSLVYVTIGASINLFLHTKPTPCTLDSGKLKRHFVQAMFMHILCLNIHYHMPIFFYV